MIVAGEKMVTLFSYSSLLCIHMHTHAYTCIHMHTQVIVAGEKMVTLFSPLQLMHLYIDFPTARGVQIINLHAPIGMHLMS